MKIVILILPFFITSCVSVFQSRDQRVAILEEAQQKEIIQAKADAKDAERVRILDYMKRFYSNMRCERLPVDYGILIAEDTCRRKYKMLVDDVGDFEVICFKECVNI